MLPSLPCLESKSLSIQHTLVRLGLLYLSTPTQGRGNLQTRCKFFSRLSTYLAHIPRLWNKVFFQTVAYSCIPQLLYDHQLDTVSCPTTTFLSVVEYTEWMRAFIDSHASSTFIEACSSAILLLHVHYIQLYILHVINFTRFLIFFPYLRVGMFIYFFFDFFRMHGCSIF